MIIQRSVAFGTGLQTVVEIQHDFIQRHFVNQHHATAADVFKLFLIAALFFQQLEHFTHKIFTGDYGCFNDRLFNLFDLRWIGELRRIINFNQRTICAGDFVTHTGSSGNQVNVELAFQSFLHNFHMQQAEESTTKSKA